MTLLENAPALTTTQAPIVPGFHPDPSICRVGEDYFLVTSSFEYFPGVPILRSRDLRSWSLLGNVLDRPSQLAPGGGGSRGIYAPTLRHHDGRFWMITTDVSGPGSGHLIVTAKEASGPWSDPVRVVGAPGIDPDLAWDEDGTCVLTWCGTGPLSGIVQARLDTTTGMLLEAPRSVWSGTGLAFPEAPHLYSRGGWWYLLVAEGGTERGHCASISRSRSISGPFEGDPANPILTHRSTTLPVQNTGHADLVEGPDGEWAMVFLGVRPRGITPMFHVNGRETFLAGVDWVDDWPVVVPDRFTGAPVDRSFTESFALPLGPRWVSPNTVPQRVLQASDGRTELVATIEADGSSGMLATRIPDEHWRARCRIDPGEGSFRFLLRLDDAHWYGIDANATGVSARARIGPLESSVARRDRTPGPITLVLASVPAAAGGPDDIELGVEDAGGYERLAVLDGRYLSTEVAGGFTGRVLGLQSLIGATVLESLSYEGYAVSG